MDSNPTNQPAPTPENQSSQPLEGDAIEKAEILIWAMLDDQLEPAEVQELTQLLEQDASVRELYIQCTQLHYDLKGHFMGETKPMELPKSPVLGSLGDLRPGTDTLPVRD